MRRIERNDLCTGWLQRAIVFLQLDRSSRAGIEAEHLRPAAHGAEELAGRERPGVSRRMDEPEKIVPLGAPRCGPRPGVTLQQPPAQIASERVSVTEEALAGTGHRIQHWLGCGSGGNERRTQGMYRSRSRRRSRFCRFARRLPTALVQRQRRLDGICGADLRERRLGCLPRRRARRGWFPFRLGQRAFHVGALLTAAGRRQLAFGSDRRQRSMETGIAMEAHAGAARKFEQLLGGAWIEGERASANEKVAQRGETSSPASVVRIRKRLDRLGEPVV